jgi:hypothetical protein
MHDRDAPRYLVHPIRCKTRLESVKEIERGRWIVADCLPLIAAGMRSPKCAGTQRQLACEPKGEASVISYERRAEPKVARFSMALGTWQMVEETSTPKACKRQVTGCLAIAEQHRASDEIFCLL